MKILHELDPGRIWEISARFCLHKGQNLSTRDMFICDLDFCMIAEIFKFLKDQKTP